mmetsp:Transcript_12155/g.24424  ORF Transcript_12155/g.24424 Transcript_12155/m.24424 type:complete len:187 (-) Transcript_12155:424-984(-)
MAFKMKVDKGEEVFSKAHEEASHGRLHRDVYTDVFDIFIGAKWNVFSAGMYRYALLNVFNFVDPKNVMIIGSEVLRDRVPSFEQIVSFLFDDPDFKFSEEQVEVLHRSSIGKTNIPKPTVSATCQEFLQDFYRHHNDNLLSILKNFEMQGAFIYGMYDLEWVQVVLEVILVLIRTKMVGQHPTDDQ